MLLGQQMQLEGRKRQVMQLRFKGLPDEEIARRLGISVDTVTGHANAARRALGVDSDLAVFALLGWLKNDPDVV
jgi:DNA-binding NarL/FixJ family response regulator